MKKTKRPLSLGAQTVRLLSDAQVARVAGAATALTCGPDYTFAWSCNCTQAYTCETCATKCHQASCDCVLSAFFSCWC